MTPTPEVCRYRLGDIAAVRCIEPDPFDGWPFYAEHMCHDARSIRLGGELIGVFGYFLLSQTEAQSFALIDRQAMQGHGKQVARSMRQVIDQWMLHSGITTVFAQCSSNDQAARVFLRAIGYRPTSGDDPDISEFILNRSKTHG